ncbi:MAG: ice-binding family protein [Anaerolineales bacterium]
MRKLKNSYVRIAIILLMVLSLVGPSFNAFASPLAYANPDPVNLKTVENFLALAATTVTSPSGPTTLNGGDLGTNADCTDFPTPCDPPNANATINGGTIHRADGVATTGQTDATAVVGNLNGRTMDQAIVAGGLNSITLARGVYDVASVGGGGDDLTGDLTLNGGPNAIFIFRFNDTFITSGTARVLLTGGVQACNVYWTSASGVTFVGSTEMVGTVFAQSSVTFPGGGAVLDGRVIAQTAAITFNNTTINNAPCAEVTPPDEEEEEEEEEDVVTGLPDTGGVTGLPDTGGAPIRNEDFAWTPLIVGGFSTAALILGVRAYRRTQLPKQ